MLFQITYIHIFTLNLLYTYYTIGIYSLPMLPKSYGKTRIHRVHFKSSRNTSIAIPFTRINSATSCDTITINVTTTCTSITTISFATTINVTYTIQSPVPSTSQHEYYSPCDIELLLDLILPPTHSRHSHSHRIF